MPLYHVDVFMPELSMPKGKYNLEYTAHAQRAAQSDRYGSIELPYILNTSSYEVIEVETDSNRRVIKIVYRRVATRTHDMCIVCVPENDTKMVVKTVWLNHYKDKHKTLDKTKYAFL